MFARKIAVVGAGGYVGLVTAACFAEMGNNVIGVESDVDKVNKLNRGIPTIQENGLEPMLKKAIGDKTISFMSTMDVLFDAEMIFIAVGTPMDVDGRANLSFLEQAAKEIGQNITKNGVIIVVKSTVPVGTAKKVRTIIEKEVALSNMVGFKFSVVSNPEFLAEGRAIKDAMEPARVIVGTDDPIAMKAMYLLYKPFCRKNEQSRFLEMTNEAAEASKYAANFMLTLKISGMNAFANLCDSWGVDVESVREAVGSDPRIGPEFLYSGLGYGGSCFGKDVQSLICQARDGNLPAEVIAMLEAPEKLNAFQQKLMAEKVMCLFGRDLTGKTFAVWGLAFKAGTDDIRASSSIALIETLLDHGAKVVAFDALAMEATRAHFADAPMLKYSLDMYSALEGAHALIVTNEDRSFRSPDFSRVKELLLTPSIFDGRNLYDLVEMRERGIRYVGIGRGEQ